MQVGKEFDKLEPDYTAKITRWVPHYREMLTSLATDYPDGFEPVTILDLGVGNGNSSALLHRAFPEADFVLVDASAKMIETCQQRFAGFRHFTFAEKYFQDLHFMPNTFDLVVGALSIHHLAGAEKRKLFEDVHLWIKPGGFFSIGDFFVDPKDEQEHKRVLGEWERLARAQGSNDDDWVYLMEHYEKYDFPNSYEDQLQWMVEAGFTDTRIPFIRDSFGTIRGRKSI